MNPRRTRLLLILTVAIAVGTSSWWNDRSAVSSTSAVQELFDNRESGVMVEFGGRVSKTLADDNDGSRHQRFIVDLGSGLTVLIAHNIDLADRVPLKTGDSVEVLGQYEWNERGGVVHWTHHDPGGNHAEGFIRHDGRLYQ